MMAKERQRHFARAHANGQLPRQMNPVYLQPAGLVEVHSHQPSPHVLTANPSIRKIL
ncbi:hypothetical protein P4O66_019957 [Electrophorus voltai]|uniref:Uncharacterized protein n=1 Tax=Electrophorus voltai TaxID=2609070 RepID=A0AAD8YRG9_9TELE|nr:hypothetical protein P4O66_019957 [Electrophorus voltai]